MWAESGDSLCQIIPLYRNFKMCNDFISLIQILCSLPTLYQSGILRVYILDPPYLLTVSCITGGSVGIRSPQIRFSVV